MIFIYPYKRKDSDFLLLNSVRVVKSIYPDAECYTVGDKVEGVKNIPFKDSHEIKGVNVTAKMLHVATLFEEFVYMNDDFFISDTYDLNKVYCSFENLERKPHASSAWNLATDNTKHWLEYNGYPIRSYECHQPVVFNSKKLIKTFRLLDWENHHFLKSIYFNVNPHELEIIQNNKLIKFDKRESDRRLKEWGWLSVGGDYLTASGIDYIKRLT